MIFCFESTMDAVRRIYDISKDDQLSSTAVYLGSMKDICYRCSTKTLPSWRDFAKRVSSNELNEYVFIGVSDGGNNICIRWDRENIGGSVLQGEFDPPFDTMTFELFDSLYDSAVMVAKEL